MPAFRLYYLLPVSPNAPTLRTCVAPRATVQDYVTEQCKLFPNRTHLAWETGGLPMPASDNERYTRCVANIAGGQWLHVSMIKSRILVDAWARSSSIISPAVLLTAAQACALEDAPIAPVAAAPTRTGKPRTLIVQEWIAQQDQAELGQRAWEATMAACKGQR